MRTLDRDDARALPKMVGARFLLAALLTARRSGRGPVGAAEQRFVAQAQAGAQVWRRELGSRPAPG